MTPSDEQLESALPAIWDAHGLGEVDVVARPRRGSVNPAFIVNGRYVVRFNVSPKSAGRFESEALAYERLAGKVPVPSAVIADSSRRLVDAEFLISTRLQGQPVIDGWNGLVEEDRERLAHAAGRHLAAIHQERYPRFGKLRDIARGGGFERWSDYVVDYFRRYAALACQLSILDGALEREIAMALEVERSLLDSLDEARLVHSDFHFENILHDRGDITGIIDFEWAFAGDPAWDFVPEGLWDRTCPGSREHLYSGYTPASPLDSTFLRRLAIYKLVSQVEFAVDAAHQSDLAGSQESLERIRRILAILG